MKSLLLLPLLLLTVSCNYKPADSGAVNHTGAAWYEITSHYTYPEELGSCKVFLLRSTDDSRMPDLNVVKCEQPVSATYQVGKSKSTASTM